MRIDAYTHFFPKKFFEKLLEVAGHYKDMGKNGAMYPRETLLILKSLNLDNETADKIFFKNLERVTDRTLVK